MICIACKEGKCSQCRDGNKRTGLPGVRVWCECPSC